VLRSFLALQELTVWPSARRYSLCCPAWQLVFVRMQCIDIFRCKAACLQ